MKSIYLVKVTRRPVLMHRGDTIVDDYLEEIAKYVSRMQSGGLAPPGISIQLVDSIHDEAIKKIECGSLAQHGIPVLHQINGV